MKRTVFIIYFITLSILLMTTKPTEGNEFTIVYTANSNGKLKGCSCPNDPYGGLSERVTLIRELRKKEKPFLLVDCGNMVSLFGGYETKASYVVRIMNLMKYDVAAAGRNEMFKGISKALDMNRISRFPMISATIAYKTKQNLVFKPYITKKVNGRIIGITAVCDSSCFIRINPQEYDYTVLPTHGTFTAILDEISSKCDLIIVLSQIAPDLNKKLLQDYPEVDIIVEGYGNRKYDPPVKTPNGVIVSPGIYGQFVGLITVEKSDGNITIKRSEMIPVLEFPEDKKAHKIVLEYNDRRL